MRRTLTTRIAAAVLAVVAGFSGPALALAHGVAHARYTAEVRAFTGADASAAVNASIAENGAFESADGPSRYPEAIHCQQCAERNNVVKLALPAAVETLVAFVAASSAPAVGSRAQVFESSREFTPDQPRAPPQLS